MKFGYLITSTGNNRLLIIMNIMVMVQEYVQILAKEGIVLL